MIHASPNILGFITYKQVVIRPDDQSVSEAVDEETMLLVKSYGQVRLPSACVSTLCDCNVSTAVHLFQTRLARAVTGTTK